MPIHGLAGGVNKQFSGHYGLVSGVNKQFQSIYGLGGGVNKQVYQNSITLPVISYTGDAFTQTINFPNMTLFKFYVGYLGAGDNGNKTFDVNFSNSEKLSFRFYHMYDGGDNAESGLRIYNTSGTDISGYLIDPSTSNSISATVTLDVNANLLTVIYPSEGGNITKTISFTLTKPVTLQSISVALTNSHKIYFTNGVVS